MATVNFIQKAKGSTVYCRFKHKDTDLSVSTNIYVSNQHWDKKNQKIKNIIAIPDRDKINMKLAALKIHILSQFNIDFSSGEIIDKFWLESVISKLYNRPDDESKSSIYLSDFIDKWLNTEVKRYRTSAGLPMNDSTESGYRQALKNLKEYENKKKFKLKLTETDRYIFDDISDFFLYDMGYAEQTTKRHIKRLKFFCARAEESNININHGYKARNHIKKNEQEYKEPYLNTDEINLVFEWETDNERLAWTRDNWIIGLWTGLRVSDFLTRLNISNISDGFIKIKGKKTGIPVAIPIHKQVKAILEKYNGLPPKITEQEFNENIKIIAKKLKFDNMMLGGIAKVNEKKQIRKEIGMYEKWQLITSHICRRSFCTNHFGKVPNQVIMDVAGWKTETQMLEYNKQTSLESAKKLKEYWDGRN